MSRVEQPQDEVNDATAKPKAAARWRLFGIGVSIVFHVLLLTGLVLWYVGRKPKDDIVGGSHEAAAATSSSSTPAPPPPKPAADVTAEQVAATLDRATEHFAAKPDEEQLSELEKQAARLEEVATAEAVDEIAEKFHQWMKTAPRAGAPAAQPVAGEFDYDSAQIHQVQRENTEGEAVIYRATLVDAAGRTLEVEMSPDEGQRAYETLERLKGFPLADQVYRQIAMPLIDKAIAAGEKMPAGNGPATAGQSPQEDDRDPFDETP